MIEIKNAIIKSTSISTEDHGVLSSWLHLDYGGSGQWFGGYALYAPKRDGQTKNTLVQANYAGHWIWRVLEVVGVGQWGDLVGKTIRVKCEHTRVHGIGHIIEDKWFFPADEFKLMELEAQR